MKANKRGSTNSSPARWGKRQESISPPSVAALLQAALAWLFLLALAVWVEGNNPALSAGAVAWTIALFGLSGAFVWFTFLRRAPLSFRDSIGDRLGGLAILALGVLLFAVLFVAWIASGEMRSSPEWPRQLVATTGAVSPLLFAGVAQQVSTFPAAKGWNARRLRGDEIVLLLLLSLMAFPLLSGALGMNAMGGAATPWRMWMMTALAAGTALFVGQVALQTLHRPGASMIVFAAALFYQALVNFGYAHTHGEQGPGVAPHVLALAAAAAMDVMYMLRLPDADSQASLQSALGVGVLTAFITAAFFRGPMFGITLLDLPLAAVAFVAVAAFGFWSGWCGAGGGRWLAAFSKRRIQPKHE